MDPKAELQRRDALLDRVGALVERDGLAALTLDSAAPALGLTSEELHEYFESKQDLIVALIARNRIRLRERFAKARDQAPDDADLSRLVWDFYLDTAADSRVFFEAYGLALHDERYGEFMLGINDWLGLLVDELIRRGVPSAIANARATLALAVYRGAMLDFCATGERARVNSAMELWFKLQDSLGGLDPHT